MCLLMSEKSLERKLMLRALCHVIDLTQLAKGMLPISCSFHSNLKSKLLCLMLPFIGAVGKLQCLPTKDTKQNKPMPLVLSAVFSTNVSST